MPFGHKRGSDLRKQILRENRPARRHYADGIYDRAQELLNDADVGRPKAIAEALRAEAAKDPTRRGVQAGTPGEAAIASWIKKGIIRKDEDDEPWSIDKAEADEIPTVLAV